MCGAVALFACLDATAKYLNRHMDTVQVVWARYIAPSCWRLFVSNPFTQPGLLRTRRPFLQLGRSRAAACLDGAELLRAALSAARRGALDHLHARSSSRSSAGPMLGEWIGWRRWTAIVVGFAGVLLVSRPGFRRHASGRAALAGGDALLRALRMIDAHRWRAPTPTRPSLFYSNLVGAALMLPVDPVRLDSRRRAGSSA